MNDKERIIRIMNEENMNAAQFSESIGIQRAAISHILAGRNNPSLDVIKKILNRFSTISPDWLLSGEGPMRRNIQNSGNSSHRAAVAGAGTTTDYDLFSQPDSRQVSKPETRPTERSSTPPNQGTNTVSTQKKSPYPADIRTKIHFTDKKPQGEEVNDTINEPKEIIKEAVIYKERPHKTIEKLLIFYTDNTFETFIPEKRDNHDAVLL
jgi:transcriptional regulator with XRE-family HTH domain